MVMKKMPARSIARRPQWWLAVLGTSLILLLTACGGSSAISHNNVPTRPRIKVVPLSSQTVEARTSAQTWIQNFQQTISQAEQRGMNVASYQMQLDEDRQEFQNAQSIQDYTQLATAIETQALVVKKSMTGYDLQTLQTLLGATDIHNDYEYRDAADAYADEQAQFEKAQTADDFQQIDDQAQILLTNLNALLTNLNDSTDHDKPHAADLQLMQHYQLTGKVVVVSLTEQTLREYDNGQLVGWMYVVTGQMAAQTPPGLWHVQWKKQHVVFKSSEPAGSALWYPPTAINYAMYYHEGGYYLHDATWRAYFGPGANLPHDDYTSGKYSITGSHGCINMTLSNARSLYNWVDVGIPVLVY
jgi:hypothetical protein